MKEDISKTSECPATLAALDKEERAYEL